jgi:hypothetical protein
MKFADEFRDRAAARALVKSITADLSGPSDIPSPSGPPGDTDPVVLAGAIEWLL